MGTQFNKSHWMSKSKTYSVYKMIGQRCKNPKNYDYKNYGWRWIICLRKSFEEFIFDMWEKPNWLKLERIDNNGNYCKENCKRATDTEQANNTRRNHFLEYKWKKQTVSQWAIELWINRETLFYRVQHWLPIEKYLPANPAPWAMPTM